MAFPQNGGRRPTNRSSGKVSLQSAHASARERRWACEFKAKQSPCFKAGHNNHCKGASHLFCIWTGVGFCIVTSKLVACERSNILCVGADMHAIWCRCVKCLAIFVQEVVDRNLRRTMAARAGHLREKIWLFRGFISPWFAYRCGHYET